MRIPLPILTLLISLCTQAYGDRDDDLYFARKQILDKAKSIHISTIRFTNVSAESAAAFLEQMSKDLDPEKRGITIEIKTSTPIRRPVSILLDDCSIFQLLSIVAGQTGLHCYVADRRLVLSNKKQSDPPLVDKDTSLPEITDCMVHHTYRKVEIIAFSAFGESLGRLSSDDLKDGYDYKYSNRDSRLLLRLLKEVKINGRGDENDFECRWGILLFRSDREADELFFDGGLTEGTWNGRHLVLTEKFKKLLKEIAPYRDGFYD